MRDPYQLTKEKERRVSDSAQTQNIPTPELWSASIWTYSFKLDGWNSAVTVRKNKHLLTSNSTLSSLHLVHCCGVFVWRSFQTTPTVKLRHREQRREDRTIVTRNDSMSQHMRQSVMIVGETQLFVQVLCLLKCWWHSHVNNLACKHNATGDIVQYTDMTMIISGALHKLMRQVYQWIY